MTEGRDRAVDRWIVLPAGWAWSDAAMIVQYAAPTTVEEDAEYAAWEGIRDAAAADMLSRPPE